MFYLFFILSLNYIKKVKTIFNNPTTQQESESESELDLEPNSIMPRCSAVTKVGKSCKKIALTNCTTCAVHRDPCSCCLNLIKNKDEWINDICGHRFHLDCIKKWSEVQATSEKTCPMCRVALPTALQYPKTIRTKFISWIMKTEQDAIDYIEFVQKRGRFVADDMFKLKMKTMMDIVLSTRRKQPVSVGDFVFSFSITKDKPVTIIVDTDLLPNMDLWNEFESLHNQLINLVAGPMD